MSDSAEVGRREAMNANGTGVLAYVFGALGLVAVLLGSIQVIRMLASGSTHVLSPVFSNPRRLPHLETLEHLASAHSVNLLIILPWYIVVALLAVFSVALVRAVHPRAPTAALTAGVFLAGSAISGLLIGTSVLKVGEFAVQYSASTAAEQEWVAAGINYLNQLHLFYVFGWFLSIGIGWIFLGAGALAAGRTARLGGRMLQAGGAILVLTVIARSWLPSHGPDAPAWVVALGEPVGTLSVGVGLVGCTLVWRAHAGARARRDGPAPAVAPGALPDGRL